MNPFPSPAPIQAFISLSPPLRDLTPPPLPHRTQQLQGSIADGDGKEMDSTDERLEAECGGTDILLQLNNSVGHFLSPLPCLLMLFAVTYLCPDYTLPVFCCYTVRAGSHHPRFCVSASENTCFCSTLFYLADILNHEYSSCSRLQIAPCSFLVLEVCFFPARPPLPHLDTMCSSF
jgi:hypothetical protein